MRTLRYPTAPPSPWRGPLSRIVHDSIKCLSMNYSHTQLRTYKDSIPPSSASLSTSFSPSSLSLQVKKFIIPIINYVCNCKKDFLWDSEVFSGSVLHPRLGFGIST